MIKLKSLTVAGFRGIRTVLRIPLTENGLPSSAIIYGRNGTGKSSLTDAWEWFTSGRIDHLAREGAREASYANRLALRGESYVEVEFSDPRLGVLRAEHDIERVTKPARTGDFDLLSQFTSHPCHIRFADLTRFVYLSKTERYDLLAQFMGFTPQVEMQKALRRVQRQFEDIRAQHDSLVATHRKGLEERVGLPLHSASAFAQSLNPLLIRHGLSPAGALADLPTRVSEMKLAVVSDPHASLTLALRSLRDALKPIAPHGALITAMTQLHATATPFKEREEEVKALLLLNVYRAGREALLARAGSQQCPLCGKTFDGDLAAHVEAELLALETLRHSFDATSEALTKAREESARSRYNLSRLELSVASLSEHRVLSLVRSLLSELNDWNTLTTATAETFPPNAQEVSADFLDMVLDCASKLVALSERIRSMVAQLDSTVAEELVALEKDESRLILVADFQKLSAAAELAPKFFVAISQARTFSDTATELSLIIETYCDASRKDVEARFETISDDVSLFFGILEQSTPGLSKPSLKISEDQERSVVPEVYFHGQAVAPAYRYLSESQLNSFGLSVFLASVRRFNQELGFILLDDVVNSLDGYKRPYLIDLLKDHFAKWQVIVLTHDSVWKDRLVKQLNSWQRIHFTRHEVGIGPISTSLVSDIEEVEALLTADKPKQAGQVLGPLIEAELQLLCESCEAPLKYRRFNDHTLEPLLVALRSRLEDKLGKAHQASLSARALEEDTGFRNLCAHAKNPETEITGEEIARAKNRWLSLAGELTCSDPTCDRSVRWTGSDFRCPCTKLVLKK